MLVNEMVLCTASCNALIRTELVIYVIARTSSRPSSLSVGTTTDSRVSDRNPFSEVDRDRDRASFAIVFIIVRLAPEIALKERVSSKSLTLR